MTNADSDGSARAAGAAPLPLALLVATALAGIPAVMGGHIFLPDDVYFYLKIAGEIVLGNGSTFNGLVPTNGYHPLWMGVCILERLAVGSDPHALIRLHLVVTFASILVTIALAHRLGRALGLDGVLGAGLVGAYLAYNALGSEIHVALPLALLAALWIARGRDESAGGRVAIGALLGLVMLGRLDNVFVAGALAGCAAWGRAPRDLPALVRRGLQVGVPATLVVAPYLAWNWLTFGHLVPVSGSIKAGLAAETPYPLLGRQFAVLIGLAPLSLAAAWWLAPRASRARTVWLAIAAGAVLHAGYVLLRAANVWSWYFGSELLAAALLAEAAAAWVLQRVPGSGRWAPSALRIAVLVPMLAIAAANLSHLRGGDERWFLELVRWMDENLPPGTAVAATCSPGGVGYFSEHPVFALDGLTGDFAFHERAAELGLREALAELGIGYVYSFGPRSTEVAHFARITEARGHGGEAVAFYATPEGDGESRLRAIGLVSPLIGRDVGTICLGPDLLVGEGFPGRRMGIWKLPDDDGCAARSTGDRLSP